MFGQPGNFWEWQFVWCFQCFIDIPWIFKKNLSGGKTTLGLGEYQKGVIFSPVALALHHPPAMDLFKSSKIHQTLHSNLLRLCNWLREGVQTEDGVGQGASVGPAMTREQTCDLSDM